MSKANLKSRKAYIPHDIRDVMVRNDMNTGRGAFKPYYIPAVPPSRQMHAELKAFVPQTVEPTDFYAARREAPPVAPIITILGLVEYTVLNAPNGK